MVEEIRQDGRVILSSEDGFSVPMIFNNLCGKNFIGKEYKDYIRHIAFEEWDLSRASCPIIGTVFYIRTAQSRNFEQVNQNRNSKNQNLYKFIQIWKQQQFIRQKPIYATNKILHPYM